MSTAVITGATRGLGRAMAERLVEAGWTVAGCGRSTEAITELRMAYAPPHRFDVVDVADDAQVTDWSRDVLSTVGPPDLLINNAAIINANAPLWNVPCDEFSRMIDINIKGMFHVLRHFVPAMIDAGKGIIVNFSSGWGRSTSADVAPYCASKFAVEGMTLALAQELPKGMAAVALNPGVIDTEMLRSCFGGGAGAYPNAKEWSRTAVPFLLKLGPKDNGGSLTAPG